MAKKRKIANSNPPLSVHGMHDEASSLARGLEILRGFRPGENSLSIAEIASSLSLPRPTTARLVETLTAHQFLRSIPGTDSYQPDISCLVVGRALLASLSIIRIVRPTLQELADRFGLNVVLGVRERLDTLCLEHCVGNNTQRFRYGVGALAPLVSTALGRAWLWAQPGVVQGELIDQIRIHADEKTKRSLPGLYRAFQEMEELGYCFSFGEWSRDVHAVATPLILDGAVRYSISCKATGIEPQEQRFRTEVGPALLSAVATIKNAIVRMPVD